MLQEYNRVNEEIAEAMGSISVGPQVDDAELDEELAELQQKELEDKMLETGAVPADRLPAVANGESELTSQPGIRLAVLMGSSSQRESACRRSGRRGGGTQKVAGRDGHVRPGRLSRWPYLGTMLCEARWWRLGCRVLPLYRQRFGPVRAKMGARWETRGRRPPAEGVGAVPRITVSTILCFPPLAAVGPAFCDS